jgi:hypothetical protein
MLTVKSQQILVVVVHVQKHVERVSIANPISIEDILVKRSVQTRRNNCRIVFGEGTNARGLWWDREGGQRPLRVGVAREQIRVPKYHPLVPRRLLDRENVDRSFVARATKKLRIVTEIDAIDGGGVGASSQLEQFGFSRQLPHPDQGALDGRGCDFGRLLVERHAGDFALVGADPDGGAGHVPLRTPQILIRTVQSRGSTKSVVHLPRSGRSRFCVPGKPGSACRQFPKDSTRGCP